jgi:hypothetical protein
MIGERIADWMKSQTSVAPEVSKSNEELQQALAQLKEAVATAAGAEIPEPNQEVVQEATRLIKALHNQVPREYMVYLMPNGSIAIDTRGTRPDGAFITLRSDGSAFCSSRRKGDPWRQRYDASTMLPDETLLQKLRSLDPAGA